jgi:hypothetical protein
MAEKLRCSPTRWNGYEKGTTPIQIPEAIRLAEEHGVSLDWLYRGIKAMLPVHLAEKIAEIEAKEQAGESFPRKRRSFPTS